MAKSESFKKIENLTDAAGRLGYEIKEVDFFDEGCADSYETVGSSLIQLINDHPEEFEIIEKTIIAITGYGFDSLHARMIDHKKFYNAL